jgi:hypothetical protein
MKYAVEMGSVAMTYTPSFVKIDSCIQRVGFTHTACRSHKRNAEFALRKITHFERHEPSVPFVFSSAV